MGCQFGEALHKLGGLCIDVYGKDMDDSFRITQRPKLPLQLVRRRHPLDLQLAWIYHEANKSEWVDRKFITCNFSFILRGTGSYAVDGQSHQVRAPCVFIQEPESHHSYGPDETWEEFSLLYSPDARETLRQRAYLGGQSLWPITNPPRLLPLIEELISMRDGGELWSNADRADRLADLLLFESQQQRPAIALTPARQRVQALLHDLEADPAQPTDIAAWLRRCGLSESSFRRAWGALSRRSPADHHQHLRLRQACRLLIETSLTIAEISAAVGFEDPLYFSRVFSRKMGVPPTGYRRQQTIMAQSAHENVPGVKTAKPDQ